MEIAAVTRRALVSSPRNDVCHFVYVSDVLACAATEDPVLERSAPRSPSSMAHGLNAPCSMARGRGDDFKPDSGYDIAVPLEDLSSHRQEVRRITDIELAIRNDTAQASVPRRIRRSAGAIQHHRCYDAADGACLDVEVFGFGSCVPSSQLPTVPSPSLVTRENFGARAEQ